jgi:transposase
MKINQFGSDGHTWCWKSYGEAPSNHTCQPTVKHSGGSLMVWGCMTAKGIGYMTKIEGNMNADLYCQILHDELMDSLDYYNLNPADVIFQQDNNLKHTSKLAKACTAELSLQILEWPAQSPDLNPIEHLWEHLKCQLNAWLTRPSGMLELWERVKKEWEAIDKKVILDLIDSMPSWVEAVQKAKGGPTKY